MPATRSIAARKTGKVLLRINYITPENVIPGFLSVPEKCWINVALKRLEQPTRAFI